MEKNRDKINKPTFLEEKQKFIRCETVGPSILPGAALGRVPWVPVNPLVFQNFLY